MERSEKIDSKTVDNKTFSFSFFKQIKVREQSVLDVIIGALFAI